MTDPTLNTSHPILVIMLLVLLAVLVSRALVLLGRMEGADRVRRWLPLFAAITWSGVLAAGTFTIAGDRIELRLLLVLFFFAILAISSISWMRSLVAGIILAWERRLNVGDHIQTSDNIQGEIITMGIRTVRLRSPDGTLHDIPHETLLKQSVGMRSSTGEVVCEIPFTVGSSMSAPHVIALAREAAGITPLASPHHTPEVFLVDAPGPDQPSHYIIRGYAFSPEYRDNYRSDVLSRLHAILRPQIDLNLTSIAHDSHLLLPE